MSHPIVIECFAVVDEGVLLYESIEETPREALCAATWEDEDGNDVHARMLRGLITVHSIRIEILHAVAGEQLLAKKKPS